MIQRLLRSRFFLCSLAFVAGSFVNRLLFGLGMVP
jgi:hypothetical protein